MDGVPSDYESPPKPEGIEGDRGDMPPKEGSRSKKEERAAARKAREEAEALKKETQRLLRDAATTDRIGKGYNPEIKPFTGLLAKLQQRTAAIQQAAKERRRPKLNIRTVAGELSEEESELEIVEEEAGAAVVVAEAGAAGEQSDEESELLMFNDEEEVVAVDYDEELDDEDEKRRRRREAKRAKAAAATRPGEDGSGDAGGTEDEVAEEVTTSEQEEEEEEKEEEEEEEEEEEGGEQGGEGQAGDESVARDSDGQAVVTFSRKDRLAAEGEAKRVEVAGVSPLNALAAVMAAAKAQGPAEEVEADAGEVGAGGGVTGKEFLAMEAEMSDDEGHTEDDDSADEDDDGNLAELIDGEAKERKRDGKIRDILNMRLLEEDDRKHLEAVMRGVKTGWQTKLKRRPADDALGGDLGSDAAARRRRAMRMGADDDEGNDALDAAGIQVASGGGADSAADMGFKLRARRMESAQQEIQRDSAPSVLDFRLDEASQKLLNFVKKNVGGGNEASRDVKASSSSAPKKRGPSVTGGDSASLMWLTGSDPSYVGSLSLLQDSQVGFLGAGKSQAKRPRTAVDADHGNSKSFVFARTDTLQGLQKDETQDGRPDEASAPPPSSKSAGTNFSGIVRTLAPVSQSSQGGGPSGSGSKARGGLLGILGANKTKGKGAKGGAAQEGGDRAFGSLFGKGGPMSGA